MVTATRTWGAWYLINDSLAIQTPGGYEYSLPIKDLRDPRMYNVVFQQLSVKPWITVDDMLTLRKAVKELNEEAC
jgi:hypothetical protein